jgi:hypothetical protein
LLRVCSPTWAGRRGAEAIVGLARRLIGLLIVGGQAN